MKNKAIRLLESVSLRQTRPRLAILNVLLETDGPLTQDQIAEQIGPESPNKTTIYRTLTQLVENGVVHEAFTDHRSQYYELSHHCGKQCCHPHFTCSKCQKTRCMTGIESPLVQLPNGYTLHRQQIRIEGVCPQCAG